MKKRVLKKSQISIFVIFAIIIVVIISLFFLLQEKISINNKVPEEFQPIYSFVQECIKKTGENGVYYIGQTGGYFTSPNQSIDIGIAYYYYQGKNLMPSKEEIEKELEDYTEFMLPFCFQNFSEYPEFKVKTQKPKIKTKIEDEKVVFFVNYPMTISKAKKSFFIQNFEKTEIPVRLGRIYEIANNITDDHLKNGNNICISCINSYATDLDLYVEIDDYKGIYTDLSLSTNDYLNNDTSLFIIVDKKSSLFNEDYEFYFANKYQK